MKNPLNVSGFSVSRGRARADCEVGGDSGVCVNRFFVQQMKTKWGSFNPRAGTIRLNTELAKKPKECLKYIVVHEMVHLLEPHTISFRRTDGSVHAQVAILPSSIESSSCATCRLGVLTIYNVQQSYILACFCLAILHNP